MGFLIWLFWAWGCDKLALVLSLGFGLIKAGRERGGRMIDDTLLARGWA